MKNERRQAPRWRASSNKFTARVRHEDNSTSEAMIIDVSHGGIGLRADRHRFAIGMRVDLELDLLDEKATVRGIVRFVDPLYPRVGLSVDAREAMEKVVRRAARGGFMMTEVRGETLVVNGSVTVVALKEFDSVRRYRTVDLSGVNAVSVAGAGIVSAMARKGVKIERCSEPIAPLFDSLGICDGAKLCVATEPCDLPKEWPTRRRASGPAPSVENPSSLPKEGK